MEAEHSSANTPNLPEVATLPLPARLNQKLAQSPALLLAALVAALLLGALIGALVSLAFQPKPVNPSTYTKPLQAQLTTLREQQAYARIITIDYPLDALNYNLMSDNCTYSSSTAECEVDLTNLARDDGQFATDLKALHVPACLASANTLFLQGLPQEVSGAAALEQAVKNNDAGAESTAVTQLSQGFDGVSKAMVAYKSATC